MSHGILRGIFKPYSKGFDLARRFCKGHGGYSRLGGEILNKRNRENRLKVFIYMSI